MQQSEVSGQERSLFYTDRECESKRRFVLFCLPLLPPFTISSSPSSRSLNLNLIVPSFTIAIVSNCAKFPECFT